jgi:hypothetical protein
VIWGALVLAVACPPVCADGGALRLSAVQRDYRISVFTAPTPFRAGPVDISVLVQDHQTGELVPAAQVRIRMKQPGRQELAFPATFETATNKLFQAAQFELPYPGSWEIQVHVDGPHGPAEIGSQIDAAPALPGYHDLWVWIGWPAVPIVLFGVHQVLVQSAGRRRAIA